MTIVHSIQRGNASRGPTTQMYQRRSLISDLIITFPQLNFSPFPNWASNYPLPAFSDIRTSPATALFCAKIFRRALKARVSAGAVKSIRRKQIT
jgi:hypothetical protein